MSCLKQKVSRPNVRVPSGSILIACLCSAICCFTCQCSASPSSGPVYEKQHKDGKYLWRNIFFLSSRTHQTVKKLRKFFKNFLNASYSCKNSNAPKEKFLLTWVLFRKMKLCIVQGIHKSYLCSGHACVTRPWSTSPCSSCLCSTRSSSDHPWPTLSMFCP